MNAGIYRMLWYISLLSGRSKEKKSNKAYSIDILVIFVREYLESSSLMF